MTEILIKRPKPHAAQKRFIKSKAKRKIVRAGRRSGKTVGLAIYAGIVFLAGRRVLYAAPTQEQIDRFWHEIKLQFDEAVDAGVFYKNETRHIIELPGTEQRIRAKTAWNADTLRGDYADDLLLDEWQLMNEDTWERVGAPMLLDNNGNVIFGYTPPYFHSRSTTKATDPLHAAKLYKKAETDETGRWAAFTFSSFDNPHISREALDEIASDMTRLNYEAEILARDIEDIPGALWKRSLLDETRRNKFPELHRIAVAIDPAASTGQTGIVVVGICYIDDELHGFTLDDATTEMSASTAEWGSAAVAAYHKWDADILIGEVNNGGDMVEHVIRTMTDGDNVNYKTVRASRGKYTRAEPVAALFEHERAHMVGYFPLLEQELISWVPGDPSPNRLDALVWAYTELMLGKGEPAGEIIDDLDMNIYKSKREKSIWGYANR